MATKRANRKASKRSLAAKRGWITRRKREAAEHRRRSKAAKLGWRRRKAREAIAKRAQEPPKARKGPLREYLVNFSYEGKKPRTVAFTVIARSQDDAITSIYKAIEKGQDSNGYDLTWMSKIPWDEVDATEIKDGPDKLTKTEIKLFGEGWVEKH